jgi:hypothetical protein
MEILRHVMDGQRGAITALEYLMLASLVEEQLDRAVLKFMLEGLPPELATTTTTTTKTSSGPTAMDDSDGEGMSDGEAMSESED